MREAAAEALGTALKVVGERGMAAYLDGLESLKMTKVGLCDCHATIMQCVCEYQVVHVRMYVCMCVLPQVSAVVCLQVNEVRDRVELQPPRGVHAKAARKRAEEEPPPVKKSGKPKKEKEEKGEEGSAEPPPPKPKKKKKVAKKVSPPNSGVVVTSMYALCPHGL